MDAKWSIWPRIYDRRSVRDQFANSHGNRLMANTPSAEKAIRKIARRTEVNRARRSRVRTFIREVEAALQKQDRAAAKSALKIAEPEMMRAVSKGVVHHNTGSRIISRLTKRMQKLPAAV